MANAASIRTVFANITASRPSDFDPKTECRARYQAAVQAASNCRSSDIRLIPIAASICGG